MRASLDAKDILKFGGEKVPLAWIAAWLEIDLMLARSEEKIVPASHSEDDVLSKKKEGDEDGKEWTCELNVT